ncbi:MAG: hypothetical protein NT075_08795 [Chloroflexi bacterium]|nr:hypothetical protein [Chloroflexota bacterium]
MSDRFALIARKQEVRRQIEHIRRHWEREQRQLPVNARRLNQLATQLEQLMAEEYNLRIKIDQSKDQ